jgi:hypothetical protein
MNLIKLSTVLCMILFSAAPASAKSNLTISPSETNTFLLQGIGLEGAAAVECTITYDAGALGNPRVNLGSLAAGAMMAVNPNVPGIIRMALVRTTPMTGNGSLATIGFDRKGDAPGRILNLSAKLVTIDGKHLDVAVSISNPPDTSTPSATTTTANTEVPGQTAAVPGQTATVQGTATPGQTLPVFLPAPVAPAVPLKPQEPDKIILGDDSKVSREQTVQQEKPDKDPVNIAKNIDVTSQVVARGIYTQKSVLERFKEYKGEQTVPAYIALFEKEEMIGFRQDPPVALTDGMTTVRITFISASSDRKTSDIAVMGAKLLSLKKDPDYSNTFVIELLPFKGEYQASVSVPQDGVLMIYPLTLARKVPMDLTRTGMADETAFKAFLKDRGTKEKPGHDLNGDGRRDYLDDYLYTANYLAARNQALDRKDQK